MPSIFNSVGQFLLQEIGGVLLEGVLILLCLYSTNILLRILRRFGVEVYLDHIFEYVNEELFFLLWLGACFAIVHFVLHLGRSIIH